MWTIVLYSRVNLEIPAVNAESDVAKALIFEQQAQVICQPALGYFELYGI